MGRIRGLARHAAAGIELAATVALGGCSLFGPSAEQLIRDDISADLDALATADSDARQAIVDDLAAAGGMGELGIDAQAFSDALFEGLAYEITGVDVDDEAGTAVAHVTLTCKSLADIASQPDQVLSRMLADADVSAMTQEEIAAELGDALVETLDDEEPTEHELDLGYTRGDGDAWSPDASVVDAIAGALIE